MPVRPSLSQEIAGSNRGKTYVSGGTTKDNPIVLSKPKPNYLIYVVVGVLGILVINRLFFNKN